MALSDWRSAVTPVGKHAAALRPVPCGSAVLTGPSTPGLRPFGRDDGQRGPKGRLITVIPSKAVQSVATRREAEESVRQRREATPLMAWPHGVSGWRTDQRSPPIGKNGAAPPGVPCGRAARTGSSTPGLRPFGRDDGQGGPKGRLITVIPSEAVQSAATRREAEEPVLQRRAATPIMLLRHDVGCLVGCVMALSGGWTDQRSPPIGKNGADPRGVPCRTAIRTDPSTPGLRPFGRYDVGGLAKSSGGSH